MAGYTEPNKRMEGAVTPKPNVLVVEDEKNIRDLVCLHLGLEHLAPLEDVKVLDLYYAESVTDLGIAHLKHWKNLEHLKSFRRWQ